MTAPGDEAWLQPKRYGYGAGLPVSWQDWLATALFLALALSAGLLLKGGWRLAAIAVLMAVFDGLAARKTRGGWRWRWGDDS